MPKPLLPAMLALFAIAVGAHQQPFTVSVDVNVVTMNVRVSDHDGHPVAGLNRSDFSVYDERKLQEISFFNTEDSPATIGLIVDASNSMVPKWSAVRDAVAAFARASNPQDEMFMVVFNEHIYWPIKGKDFTNNPDELVRAMNTLAPQGTTALYDAIAAALEHSKLGQFQKKVFVVVSDGEDNSSDRSLQPLLVSLQEANVTVYSIGIYDPDADDKNPKVLKRLSAATGGESFFPKQKSQTQFALTTIADRIRSQYTLGFYPNVPPDGQFHKLSLRLNSNGRGSSIQTRPGYFARKNQP